MNTISSFTIYKKSTNKIIQVCSLLLCVSLFFVSCKKNKEETEEPEKTSGFNSIKEMTQNSRVKSAMDEARLIINEGNTPPNIEGDYSAKNVGSRYYKNKNNNSYFEEGEIKLENKWIFSNQTSIGSVLWGKSNNGESPLSSFLSGSGTNFTAAYEADNRVRILSGEMFVNGEIYFSCIEVRLDKIIGSKASDYVFFISKGFTYNLKNKIVLNTYYINNSTIQVDWSANRQVELYFREYSNDTTFEEKLLTISKDQTFTFNLPDSINKVNDYSFYISATDGTQLSDESNKFKFSYYIDIY